MIETMNENRFDVGVLQNIEYTANGFIKAVIRATKVGIFNYVKPDGSIGRELRPHSSVFDQISMDSLANVPITLEHPTEMLNPENVKQYQEGVTADTVVNADPYLEVGSVFQSAELISRIKSGMREVSCGYNCQYENTPGIWEGQPYDRKQINIVYNHVAVTKSGRAGKDVCIRLDAAEMIIDDDDSGNENKGDVRMAKTKIGNSEFEVSEAVASALETKARMDSMSSEEIKNELTALKTEMAGTTQKIADLEKKLSESEGKNEVLESEVKDAKEKLDSATSEEKMDSLVLERTELREKAKSLYPEIKFDSLSPMAIKKTCIEKLKPEVKLDGKDDNFVNGAFDMLEATSETKLDSFGKEASQRQTTSKPLTADEARKKSMIEDSDRWQKPIGRTLAD